MAATGRKLRRAGALAAFPLLAVFTACSLFMLPRVGALLQYDRQRIGDGEVWRLFSSHWTHWSAEHLFWDLAVFAVLSAWSLRISPGRTAIVLGAASGLIPLGIYWMQPGLTYYRGLSGLDAALFAFLATHLVAAMKRAGDRAGLLLVAALWAGLCLKIAYEMLTGQAVCVSNLSPGVVVVPLAHIIGAAVGMVAGLRPAGNAAAAPMHTRETARKIVSKKSENRRRYQAYSISDMV
jgi:rhomboid family GlyGly-CTERM serine protease